MCCNTPSPSRPAIPPRCVDSAPPFPVLATAAVLTLAFDPTGMSVGTYSCRVDVGSAQTLVDSATRTLAVSLTLRQAPRIAVDIPNVSAAISAGGDAAPVRLQITNAGSGT